MGSGLSGGLTRRGVALLASFILLSSPLFINFEPTGFIFRECSASPGFRSGKSTHFTCRSSKNAPFSFLFIIIVSSDTFPRSSSSRAVESGYHAAAGVLAFTGGMSIMSYHELYLGQTNLDTSIVTLETRSPP